ncbi:MAG: hypothetical protein WBO97_02775 [Tepidiformaceae bacterium]
MAEAAVEVYRGPCPRYPRVMLFDANWNQRDVEQALALGPNGSLRIAKTAGYLGKGHTA